MNVVIVQARVGSSRLPGKILREVKGLPMLNYVLARVKAIPNADLVCCAIPEGEANDELAQKAAQLGATVTRGSEKDVLSRYVIAARATNAQVVIRITSDCPFLDPMVSGRVLADFLTGGADYVSNVEARSWPHGLDTEVFTRAALEEAGQQATLDYDREHVTPWLRTAAHIVRRNVALSTDRYATWRWTLDYPEDLEFVKAVLEYFPPFPFLPSFEEVRAVVEAHPEVAAINAHLGSR